MYFAISTDFGVVHFRNRNWFNPSTGGSIVGVPKLAGWFISWKIPLKWSKMDDNWGYPYFRKPPNGFLKYETIYIAEVVAHWRRYILVEIAHLWLISWILHQMSWFWTFASFEPRPSWSLLLIPTFFAGLSIILGLGIGIATPWGRIRAVLDRDNQLILSVLLPLRSVSLHQFAQVHQISFFVNCEFTEIWSDMEKSTMNHVGGKLRYFSIFVFLIHQDTGGNCPTFGGR